MQFLGSPFTESPLLISLAGSAELCAGDASPSRLLLKLHLYRHSVFLDIDHHSIIHGIIVAVALTRILPTPITPRAFCIQLIRSANGLRFLTTPPH